MTAWRLPLKFPGPCSPYLRSVYCIFNLSDYFGALLVCTDLGTGSGYKLQDCYCAADLLGTASNGKTSAAESFFVTRGLNVF